MAELENKEVDTDIDTETLDNDDIDTDIQTEEWDDWDDEISYEQALEWKEKAERLSKAESKIVELKKQAKDNSKSWEDVRAILAEEKFYDKNSDAEPYRKEIEKFVKVWISREDAFDLVSKKDKQVEETRKVYWKPLVGSKSWSDISVLTIESFDKMTPSSQDEYTKKMTEKYGTVKFK